MKLSATREVLLKPLQAVIGVVERRQTMPILSNVLLVAKDGELAVTATDLEVELVAQANVDVQSGGEITVSGRKLLDICRALPDGVVVNVSASSEKLVVKAGRSRFNLATLPAAEFPVIEDIKAGQSIRVSQEVLGRLIEKTHFSMAQQDVRYYLNGMLLETGDKHLRAVATDGHRLALCQAEIDGKLNQQQVIVPRKALNEVSKLTDGMGEDDKVIFGQSDKQAFFIVGRHKLTSNLLEGKFPRYENVMPESSAIHIVLDREDLANAVRRVSLLASDRYGRAIRLHLSDGKLDLSSQTEMGEAQEALNVDYEGEEVQIGFNARYLLDFLNVVGGSSVGLELNPAREGDDAQAAAIAGVSKQAQKSAIQ